MRTLFFSGVLLAFAIGCGKRVDVVPAGEKFDNASELKALEGKWVVESFEAAGDRKPSATHFNDYIAEVKDNRLTITKPYSKPIYATVTLSMFKDNKTLELCEVDENGKTETFTMPTKSGERPIVLVLPDTVRGIYKFEGEKLVLALSDFFGGRPKSFQAVPMNDKDPDQGVIVLRLKRIP